MTDNVLNKLEALRIATLMMTQSATAAKSDLNPTPEQILKEAKTIHEWLIEKK